jgi:hypothetical protein
MSRKKFTIYLLSIAAAAAVAAWLFVMGQENDKKPEVCIKSQCYKVESAVTPQERTQGLMFRESLGRSSGMLFEFGQEGIYSFWMKNTLIPLDIVWIGADKKIIFISKNTPPCSGDICPPVNPGKNASYVLEINAGETGRIGAKIGDDVVIR